jgi:hypothetical protein
MRLLSRIFATPASVVPNASAKPAPSAGVWLISSGWFGFDFDDQARRVLSPLGRFADGEMISFDEETLYELADRDATHR